MKVLWATICQSSSIDRETNNVSLFNILEQISVPEPPAIGEETMSLSAASGPFELFILASRTDEDIGEHYQARVRLCFPSNGAEASFPIEFDMISVHRNRIRIGFPALPISGEGIYRFIIEAGENENWYELFEIPLLVSYQEYETD